MRLNLPLIYVALCHRININVSFSTYTVELAQAWKSLHKDFLANWCVLLLKTKQICLFSQ